MRGAALGSEPGAARAQEALAVPAAHTSQPASQPVVLVAEDEDSLRGMLSIVLRSRGYEVLLCANGAEARVHLDSDTRIDAALFDLRMPVVTGTDLLAALRSNPRRTTMPAIVMSAYSDDRQARELLTAGADAFLAKPFTVQELTTALDGFLRRSV
jgi:CheY-like chemotaxis protein